MYFSKTSETADRNVKRYAIYSIEWITLYRSSYTKKTFGQIEIILSEVKIAEYHRPRPMTMPLASVTKTLVDLKFNFSSFQFYMQNNILRYLYSESARRCRGRKVERVRIVRSCIFFVDFYGVSLSCYTHMRK